MHIFLSAIMAFFGFGVAIAQNCTGNLVTNPGLESGLNEWNNLSGGSTALRGAGWQMGSISTKWKWWG